MISPASCLPVIHRWTSALYKCNEQEAQSYEVLADAIDIVLVRGKLMGASTDFDKASAMLLAKVKECRTRARTQHKETVRAWLDFQKHYRNSTKVPTQRSTKPPPPPEMTQLPSPPTEPSSTTQPTKEVSRDCWIYERRYLHAALALHHAHLMYYQVLGQAVGDLHQLERWRSDFLRDVILLFTAKMRETLGSVASALGSVHAMVDPTGFMKAKAEFLARSSDQPETPSPDEPPAQADTSGQQQPQQEQHETLDASVLPSVPGVPPPQEPAVRVADAELRQVSSFSSSEFKMDQCPVFNTARELVGTVGAPESHFLMKEGHVRRHAGIFGKWSDGLLALTADRYLHMFRSHDDPTPVWSVYMPAVEVRLVDENGTKTVEIREKKNLLLVLGSKSFYFRTFTETELSSWLACLSLAAESDDVAYRREAAAIARNADAQELRDYSLWVRRQADREAASDDPTEIPAQQEP